MMLRSDLLSALLLSLFAAEDDAPLEPEPDCAALSLALVPEAPDEPDAPEDPDEPDVPDESDAPDDFDDPDVPLMPDAVPAVPLELPEPI